MLVQRYGRANDNRAKVRINWDADPRSEGDGKENRNVDAGKGTGVTNSVADSKANP